jgi:hypothetical protein
MRCIALEFSSFQVVCWANFFDFCSQLFRMGAFALFLRVLLGKCFRWRNILDNVNQQAIGIPGDKMALAPFLRFKVKHNRQPPLFQTIIFLLDV